ncbi:MAG: Wzz/FepE/Etk N-terminal domain-containing protein [candidate division Zixibacteria bacterium]|nr:Wzz/FepE/Etk N-terminal domain-containing protein [candidate division Zixibacteria bacterium]MDH3937684.1 Wzz/FepE/Etk N-terminal domain-containing protein [candidate division Zixibacteria bacterium]MDH4032323.1 Wzz/FepE/Etk N-terminal domain-containing protein [candidate division Zixibacteria bacterium]
MNSTGSTNLWLLMEVMTRRRTLILSIVIVVTLTAVVVSLILPKYYLATALLLPPKDVSIPVAGLGRISEVVSVTKGLNLPVLVTTSDVYRRMLMSHRITDGIMEQFELVERYGARNRDEAYLTLLENAEFSVTDEGLLNVAVEDRDPTMAAEMVNSFVERLDQVNREIATSRARQNRVFIEGRLSQITAELDSARSAFESFQMTHKTVDFTQQIRLAVDQAIELKIKLGEIDLELAILRSKLGDDNAELQDRLRRRQTVAQQLDRLESTNSDSSFFSLPVSAIPVLKGQYEELYSRVRVNEGLYTTLLGQLEQAKIQENEELPTITVLDWAVPPEMRSRPKRTIMVLLAFGLSLIGALLLAAWLEFVSRLRTQSPDDYKRVSQFLNAFLGWLPGVGKPNKS